MVPATVFLGSQGQVGDLPLCRGTIYPLGTLTATSHVPPLRLRAHHSALVPFPPLYPHLTIFKAQVAILSLTSNQVF